MCSKNETFSRQLDIDVLNKSLILHQQLMGDVNCVVWDAALVLSKYLEQLYMKDNSCFKGKSVIELGAGLGCVGLTAASLGAQVLLTDLPEALDLLCKNINENQDLFRFNHGSASVKELPWGQPIDKDYSPDFIVFADCIYYKESVKPLIKTLGNLVGRNTEVLLTQEMRDSPRQIDNWNYFLDNIEPIFNVYYVPLSDQNQEYSSPDITLIRLKKKLCDI